MGVREAAFFFSWLRRAPRYQYLSIYRGSTVAVAPGVTLCGVRAQRWPVEGTLWGGTGGQQGISRCCAKP